MSWKNIGDFFRSIWKKLCNCKISNKKNTLLDTASIKVFGFDIKVTREVPIDGPAYELTVVVPRAECRFNKKSGQQEIILSSITIAHSPRFSSESKLEKILTPKITAA
jgi:hypothetical protein